MEQDGACSGVGRRAVEVYELPEGLNRLLEASVGFVVPSTRHVHDAMVGNLASGEERHDVFVVVGVVVVGGGKVHGGCTLPECCCAWWALVKMTQAEELCAGCW